jgi:hypothetical protein
VVPDRESGNQNEPPLTLPRMSALVQFNPPLFVSISRSVDHIHTPSPFTWNHSQVNHTCPPSKAIGYFLEPITCLAPFAKKPLMLTLEGVTNNDIDPSVDALRTVALPLLRRFGIDVGLELKVSKRGAPPLGGGEVFFRCPVVRALTPVKLLEMGRIKRVRRATLSELSPPACLVQRCTDTTIKPNCVCVALGCRSVGLPIQHGFRRKFPTAWLTLLVVCSTRFFPTCTSPPCPPAAQGAPLCADAYVRVCCNPHCKLWFA